MAYNLSLVQAVDVTGVPSGNIYCTTGCWMPVTDPANYRFTEWYSGDPDQIINTFPVKNGGEYRIIEYWVAGNLSKNEFPTYNNIPFSNITNIGGGTNRSATQALSWALRGNPVSDVDVPAIYDAFNSGGTQGFFILSAAQVSSNGPIFGSTDGSNYTQYGGVAGEAWVEMDPKVYGGGTRMGTLGYPSVNFSNAVIEWIVI